MAPRIDFLSDVATRCIERLTEAGYAYQPLTDEDAVRTYISVRHRRVPARPRTVHKASYSVPSHLVAGEQLVLRKARAGDDLGPHQSRKIERLNAEDGMLNDFGIQHFHLGTGQDSRRPNLIQGTEELLFAVVTESDFYAIGIYNHTWSEQAVLEVVHSNWPFLTEPYTLHGGAPTEPLRLARTFTDIEITSLRNAGINVLQQRHDGTVQMGLGGGIASDGSSFAVSRQTILLIDHIKEIEEAVTSTLAKHGKMAEEASVRLEWREGGIFAVTEPNAYAADLTGKLVIPEL